MYIHVTARRFKAHRDVRDLALDALRRLDKFYDGIVRADVILSFERKPASIKCAEINVHVQGKTISAKEKSEDFPISIELALTKVIRQLDKVKTKSRTGNRAIRKIKEGAADKGDE